MIDFFGGIDDDEDEGDDFGAELAETTSVYCPYCGQSVEMILDASGGETQEYVEDCEICCQPWAVRVSIGSDGVPHVEVQALDE